MSGDSEPSLAEMDNKPLDKQGICGPKYIYLSILLQTFSHRERLFSVACSSSTDTRKSMSYTTFESLMFLFPSRALWGISNVSTFLYQHSLYFEKFCAPILGKSGGKKARPHHISRLCFVLNYSNHLNIILLNNLFSHCSGREMLIPSWWRMKYFFLLSKEINYIF